MTGAKMRRESIYIPVIVLVLVLCSMLLPVPRDILVAYTLPPRGQVMRSMGDVYILSPSELKMMISRADNGDALAALKVHEHYAFAAHDKERAERFLDLAVKLGNADAIAIRSEQLKIMKKIEIMKQRQEMLDARKAR